MMFKTLFLHPLGPSLILALGGVLLLPLARRPVAARPGSGDALYPRSGRGTVFLAFLVLALAGAVLVRLRVSAGGPLTLQWAWQPLTVAGSELSWRLDGWNWLAALLVLCICAAVLALLAAAPAAESRQGKQAAATLWLAAAAAAFVCSDNLVTLAGSWVALDAALALRLLPGTRAQPAARAWSGLSLAGLLVLAALSFQGESNAAATLSGAATQGGASALSVASLGGSAFSQPVLALLWLAALVRAGAYPLHLWLFGADSLSAGDRVALHLVGPATGIWLLARLQSLGPAWLHRPEWAALGAVALLGTALAAWTAPDPAAAWRWIAVNRASLVVLTAYVAAAGGPSALALSLVAFALGAGLLALGQAVRGRWSWSLPAWLGALAIWGLPGTPGFLARSAFALPAPIPAGPLFFGLILVAETLLVAALWHAAGGPTVTPQKADLGDAAAAGSTQAREGSQAAPSFDAAEAAAAPRWPADRPLAEPAAAVVGSLAAIPAGGFARAPALPAAALAGAAAAQANGELRAAAPAVDGAPEIEAISGPPNGRLPNGKGVNGVNGAVPQALPLLRRSFEVARGPDPNGRSTARALVNRARSAGARLIPGLAILVTILLAAPLIAWGLWPHQLAVLAGLPSGSVPATLAQALAGTRRSVWIGLALAGFFGCTLGWLRARIFFGIRGWQEGVLAVVRLEWAHKATVFALGLAGSGLRYFARLGEGEGYVGWLALAALVLWVLLRS